MANNFIHDGDNSRRRIKRQQAIVESDTGDLTLYRDEVTKFCEDGSIVSDETIRSQIIGGEKITSHLQITGQCLICNQFVTKTSVRYCPCGKILCATCAKLDKDEGQFLCPECLKQLRRKRFWSAVWRLLTSPFIVRNDK